MQGRIRTNARNGLDKDKVKKLEFLHWNIKVQGDAQLRQADFWRFVEGCDDVETEDSDDIEDEQRWDTNFGAATRSVLQYENDMESDRIGVGERNSHAMAVVV